MTSKQHSMVEAIRCRSWGCDHRPNEEEYARLIEQLEASQEARALDRSALGLSMAAMKAFLKSREVRQIEALVEAADTGGWLTRGDAASNPASEPEAS